MRESALPTDYNFSTLGVDYADPVSWANARVKDADLVGNAKGEVLYVPPGTHSFAGYIQLDHNHKPATSDDDYFPIIISDADSKAVFDITANDIPVGLGILTNNPTRVSDIIFDFESDMDEAYYQVLSGNSGTYLNCIIRNVSTPNAAADAYLILFAGGNVFVNCAIDIGGSIESGLAPIIGLSDFTGDTAYAYNCTIADARLTYGVYGGSSAVIAKNVIAQDASLASVTGNVTQTTCAVDQGISIEIGRAHV